MRNNGCGGGAVEEKKNEKLKRARQFRNFSFFAKFNFPYIRLGDPKFDGIIFHLSVNLLLTDI